MNCKDFQKQFEVGSNLDDLAKTHLNKCENCQAFELSELNLTQMINSLPKVEAPKDFAFRLSAYINKTEKIKRPLPAVWQTLRIGLPLTAAVLILGFIIFSSNLFTPQNQNQAAVAEDKKSQIKDNIEKPSSPKKDESQEVFVAENEKTSLEDKTIPSIIETKKLNIKSEIKDTVKVKQTENAAKSVKKFNKPVEEDFSGSANFASRQPEVLLPQNNSVNAKNTEPEFIDKRKTLLEIGISMEDKNWKIAEVKKESVAERSGIQIGDVVMEINKIPVSAKIPQSENVKTKSLKVLREKNMVSINLVN